MEVDKSKYIKQAMKKSVDAVIESYISNELFFSWIRKKGRVTPQMIDKLIVEYVPKSAFTKEQLDFMQHDPVYCGIKFPEGNVKVKRDPYAKKKKGRTKRHDTDNTM